MQIVLLILLVPLLMAAMPVNPSYVSPTGGGSACTLAAPCAVSYANANVAPGDVVYLRGGTYNITTYGIDPVQSGSVGSKITFSNYTGETPILDCNDTNGAYGIKLDGSYVIVNGIEVVDCEYSVFFGHDGTASYNELSYCTIHHSDEGNTNLWHLLDMYSPGNNNWIHNNTFHTMGVSGCSEGTYDIIKIGGAGSNGCHHNTIEDNVFYSSNHTLTDDWGTYEVWRNNVGHDEGWRDSVTTNLWGTATGGSSSTMVDSTKDFVSLGVQVGWRILSSAQYMRGGCVTSISPNNTIHYGACAEFGSGFLATFANGHGYGITPCEHIPDASGSSPGQGKYGHRSFALEAGEVGVTARHILMERNRMCYASINASNGGSDAFTLMSPGNIIRYNSIYGADGPGINLKSLYSGCYGSGCNNRIYNNTIYNNGNQMFSNANSPTYRTGIYEYNGTYSVNNVIKNNIIYSNGDYIYYPTAEKADQIWKDDEGNNTNLCDSTDNDLGCTAGVPVFINADMSNMASTTLPNLGLVAGSPGIDSGKYLTKANGAGSGIYLTVDDASYFQAGSSAVTSPMGSALSSIQGDYISIGTVSNSVQISDINYTTNVITLASSMSWADNALIWLYKDSDGTEVLRGNAPDQGAYEYAPGTITGVQCTSGAKIQ